MKLSGSLHLFLIHRTCMMKVLFIAPLYGRRKPQLSYSNVVEEDKEDYNLKMAAIEKLRNENTRKRPSKRWSKVFHNSKSIILYNSDWENGGERNLTV